MPLVCRRNGEGRGTQGFSYVDENLLLIIDQKKLHQ
jgi:hypothetical protein